jgi:hypothetical protein
MNRRVALLGTSLAIDSLAAALAGVPGLELLRFEDSTAGDLANMQASAPDAVVFDMALAAPDRPFLDLLRSAGALLVGCDLATQQMLLLSSKPARLSTVDDLVRVLSGRGAQQKNEVEQALS